MLPEIIVSPKKDVVIIKQERHDIAATSHIETRLVHHADLIIEDSDEGIRVIKTRYGDPYSNIEDILQYHPMNQIVFCKLQGVV